MSAHGFVNSCSVSQFCLRTNGVIHWKADSHRENWKCSSCSDEDWE